MFAARAARLAHRWLALLVGLQLTIWAASGLYMTVVDLDFIHGDSLVRNVGAPMDPARVRMTIGDVAARHPEATRIVLRALPDGEPLYEVQSARGTIAIDAGTGAPRDALGPNEAARLARSYYAGSGELAGVVLLPRGPRELAGRTTPVWRADFDDWTATSLYVDPATGRLVSRRHRFWRWFDFLWSLHIMDYRERTDVNNALLRTATIGALLTIVAGAWLVAYAFRWGRGRGSRARNET